MSEGPDSGADRGNLDNETADLLDFSATLHAQSGGRFDITAGALTKLWDLQSGRALRTLEGHSGSVSGVAVSPDGKRAASASYDKTLRVWDLETGLTLATFHCDARAMCCAFAGGQTIVGGDAGGRLHFLYLEEPTPNSSPVT